MEDNQIKGAATSGIGQLEADAGMIIDDREMEAKGVGRQALGAAQAGVGAVQEAIEDVADDVAEGANRIGAGASAGIETLNAKASGAFHKAFAGAQKAAGTIEPFVDKRPYTALALAGVVGLLAGLLLTRSGPKIVYVRPPSR